MKLTQKLMLSALQCLDQKLDTANQQVRLIVGGGGAMLLAHQFPLGTTDIDAVPTGGMTIEELSPFIAVVAEELSLSADWLNPFYATFTHVLPSDYGSRLIEISHFKRLRVSALSREDLLIMKCFAAREKDVIHARALVKKGVNLKMVREHIEALGKKRIPGAERAIGFLTEVEVFFADTEE